MIKLKRLLIIPARGGSKRIKNKNIKKFNNKPIIFYSIESAKKSKLFNKIHVSTDNRKISNIVKKKGIEVDFLRPKKISDDKTALHDVYKFVVQKYAKLGFSFNEIWTLMPCAPNINYKDLISASKFFNKLKVKQPVIAVSKYKVPIEWAFSMNKRKKLFAINPPLQLKRSQDLKDKFYDAAQFYIFLSKNFFTKKKIVKKIRYVGFKLPALKAIDIDDVEDWKIAEMLNRSIK